jgi:tyrosine-protein phosphatase SIW14
MASRVLFINGSSASSGNSRLMPPLYFARVSDGIYRSAYPVGMSMSFVANLPIKSFICLSPSDVKPDLQEYAQSNNIQLFQFDVKINQEPFLSMDDHQVSLAIDTACNPSNQPVLLFCVTGKVRTSCVVACLRKQQNWSFSAITEEFEAFAEPEGGLFDLTYIHRFQPVTTATTETV